MEQNNDKTYCLRCGKESFGDNWCNECDEQGWHWCEKCGKFIKNSFYAIDIGGLVCKECKVKYNLKTE